MLLLCASAIPSLHASTGCIKERKMQPRCSSSSAGVSSLDYGAPAAATHILAEAEAAHAAEVASGTAAAFLSHRTASSRREVAFSSHHVGARFVGPDSAALGDGASSVHISDEAVLAPAECAALRLEARLAMAKGLSSQFTYTDVAPIREATGGCSAASWLACSSRWWLAASPCLPARCGQPFHRDEGLVSFNVPLSRGTCFEGSGAVLRPPQGRLLCHASGMRHAGHAISRGVRWVLVVFLVSTRAPQLVRRCSNLAAAEARLAAAAEAARAGRERGALSEDRNLALLVAVGAGRGLLALRDGGGGVEGRRGEGSRPQVLGERAAAARAGFVAERAEGVERWLGAALAAMGGAESEATDEAEAVRREAHHERMRDERAREAAAGDAELPPEDDAVEMASAAQLLDSVAEVGPNYTLLRSKETKAKRRKRQREDARAALDGHTVLSTGSRLEIFCDSERWYPATVMAREEDGDGRIAHQIEYDGYPDRRWWHMLDDERWRAVAEQAGTGVGGAAADGDGDAAMDRADGERGARAAGDAEAAEVRPAPPPVRRGVQRSALADALEAEDDERQEEAACGDGRPMLAPHGPALSVQLRRVRLRLREFLATQAAAGKSVPMQRTALGLHPTMRWTIRFGKWLATTRITAPRASRWHATERGDARDEEPTVRTGRGENTVYVALQHMKNHVWREIWPAMPDDARQYWRLVTKQVMSLYDGGGGGMKDAAGAAGRAAGREAAQESASHGQSEAAQRAASERASAVASRRTMAELREATTKPCTKQHLFQVGEYLWDKSVENVPKKRGSMPRSLWSCHKLAAERATDGVLAEVVEFET
ncbi:hypothetical protein EMIHUDRAFT_112832 [Emiliania huxleyi CCMP1516]|uniref:Prolyl 4-hydroxylase alpha subunit Fe(2+) 2OG dioxygenase domain-containing protein n=2 Tax=Emiliania huxleyi TaxID=2903 RepID=A0A0D3K6W9_EMIH1|nr:hypothetical protein EMIHUDRAFT_112832 [Emiliania huxleyi CCMP1516]EOD31504.1 hypothetical protein EMIHUDRAFT_112832 [Emiliania huxleyi CCMP1516]|eukprot:XP_005783933.1 hypothetical protein EMIHUDRAFT_112832 [Emiliania huxleyi CCMP1516]